jgi:transcriptional regulator with XRE-family HTH domain
MRAVAADTPSDTASLRRRELAHLLRARRESLIPEDVGLPKQRRRRTPGLRREEVAFLAGIGAAWYARLEMAHDITPSTETLLAISRSLKFSMVETEYAFELAGLGIPKFRESLEATVPEALEQMIPDVKNVAVILFDRYLTALRWNAIGDAMFVLSKTIGSVERNTVRRLMNDPKLETSFGADLERIAGEIIAMFRRAYLGSEPTAYARQIYEDIVAHPRLAQFWHDQVVGEDVFEGGKGPFERINATIGPYSVLTTNLIVSRQQGTILRVLAPADEHSVGQFARLAELGTPSNSETVVFPSPLE